MAEKKDVKAEVKEVKSEVVKDLKKSLEVPGIKVGKKPRYQ